MDGWMGGWVDGWIVELVLGLLTAIKNVEVKFNLIMYCHFQVMVIN